MPELPEVETLVLQLRKAIKPCRITKVEIRNAGLLNLPARQFQKTLTSKKILQISRRGKYIRFQLSGKFTLWLHLGMTGQLFLEDPSWPLKPHTHLILSFKHFSRQLFYRDVRRFGRIFLTSDPQNQLPEGVRRLGPEPREWKSEAFISFLKKRQARIKSLLLDQKIVAGLGNIYADESLHRAGIHPLRRPYQIPRTRLGRLHTNMCEVLEEAIARGGSSTSDYLHLNSRPGSFQKFHRVYGRKGKSCLACSSLIRTVRISGRTSSFCPQCQQ